MFDRFRNVGLVNANDVIADFNEKPTFTLAENHYDHVLKKSHPNKLELLTDLV